MLPSPSALRRAGRFLLFGAGLKLLIFLLIYTLAHNPEQAAMALL